jgi:enoyl-CoA hydratase/carnithine racemase
VSTSRVSFDITGAVARFTVNRPEARNAMTLDMYDALLDACVRADASPDVRVLVIRAAGGRAFISGTDIAEFSGFTSGEDGRAYERRLDAVVDRLEQVRAVTIAQVEGVAAGGGCLIALACDLRVCTPTASFGVPVARTLGNCLSAANYVRLIDLLGPARVKDLLITARLMTAAEAQTLGLVTRMVDPSAAGEGVGDAVTAAVDELTAAIATHAPLTIWATKEIVRRTQAARLGSIAEADDVIAACYGSVDFREGVAAFLARRPPQFTGR